MAIEQNQVNTAADALAARKERVTIDSVREALGGGSFSTLSPMVKVWKEQHVAEAAAAEELPEAAQRASETAARTIWAAARADAAERIELIQANANQRAEDAEAATVEALTEVQRLEKTLESRDADLETFEKSLFGARAARDESAATVQAREATIESLREQLAEQRATSAAVNDKLEGMRDQLAVEKSRADRTEERLETATAALKEMRAERDTLQAESKQATRQIEKMRATSDAAAARASEIETERDTLRSEATDAVRELERSRASADALAEQVKQLRDAKP